MQETHPVTTAVQSSASSDGLDGGVVVFRAIGVKEKVYRAAKGKLIQMAAQLLTGRLSDVAEDWPKSTPRSVLREIERHNDLLRLVAIELRRVADSI